MLCNIFTCGARFSCLVLAIVGCGRRPQPSVGPATTNENPSAASTTTPTNEMQATAEIASFPTSEPAAPPIATAPASTPATSTPPTSTPNSAKPASKPAATAEQIARWKISGAKRLELVACYDGFSDSLLQSVAITEDGKQFAIGGARITLWTFGKSAPEVDLIEKRNQNEFARPIRALSYSRDGKLLAAGDQSGRVLTWNALNRIESTAIKAHKGRVVQLAFSPDSKYLATTSYDGEIRVWNATDGTRIASFKASQQQVGRLLFVTERLLACVGMEVTLWDIASGKQESKLTQDRITVPALALSRDGKRLAFSDGGTLRIWDVASRSTLASLPMRGGAVDEVDFSSDGKYLATWSQDSIIRIWDLAFGQCIQAIDADGDRTNGLKWLSQGQLLTVSEGGRIRIWGDRAVASAQGITPLTLPEVPMVDETLRKPFSTAQQTQIVDIRSLPQLPDAEIGVINEYMVSYQSTRSREEAELFYRHVLVNAGWTETSTDDQQYGLTFRKQGCELTLGLASYPEPGGGPSKLNVSLSLPGNYDVRWLPKISQVNSQSTYEWFHTTGYRTNANVSELEVGILKQFHALGWTPYARLNASSREEPDVRHLNMVQGGNHLSVYISRPADAPNEFAVQTSVHVTNKSVPVPADCGWIEFDSSTDLQLVANTKMTLQQAVEFYDQQMKSEGWSARAAARRIDEEKEKKAWLPYIRGQQDATIRLVALPNGSTRIIVGKAEQSSWQLAKPPEVSEENQKLGIEAAEFPLPKSITDLKFDVDEKRIDFKIKGLTTLELADEFGKLLEPKGWKRTSSGVKSPEYVLAEFKNDKAEIQLRARGETDHTSASVAGDALLWSKPLPTPAVRISYESWLRRHRYDTTLDRLDEFAREMSKL